jgi:hypothetical protein
LSVIAVLPYILQLVCTVDDNAIVADVGGRTYLPVSVLYERRLLEELDVSAGFGAWLIFAPAYGGSLGLTARPYRHGAPGSGQHSLDSLGPTIPPG